MSAHTASVSPQPQRTGSTNSRSPPPHSSSTWAVGGDNSSSHSRSRRSRRTGQPFTAFAVDASYERSVDGALAAEEARSISTVNALMETATFGGEGGLAETLLSASSPSSSSVRVGGRGSVGGMRPPSLRGGGGARRSLERAAADVLALEGSLVPDLGGGVNDGEDGLVVTEGGAVGPSTALPPSPPPQTAVRSRWALSRIVSGAAVGNLLASVFGRGRGGEGAGAAAALRDERDVTNTTGQQRGRGQSLDASVEATLRRLSAERPATSGAEAATSNRRANSVNKVTAAAPSKRDVDRGVGSLTERSAEFESPAAPHPHPHLRGAAVNLSTEEQQCDEGADATRLFKNSSFTLPPDFYGNGGGGGVGGSHQKRRGGAASASATSAASHSHRQPSFLEPSVTPSMLKRGNSYSNYSDSGDEERDGGEGEEDEGDEGADGNNEIVSSSEGSPPSPSLIQRIQETATLPPSRIRRFASSPGAIGGAPTNLPPKRNGGGGGAGGGGGGGGLNGGSSPLFRNDTDVAFLSSPALPPTAHPHQRHFSSSPAPYSPFGGGSSHGGLDHGEHDQFYAADNENGNEAGSDGNGVDFSGTSRAVAFAAGEEGEEAVVGEEGTGGSRASVTHQVNFLTRLAGGIVEGATAAAGADAGSASVVIGTGRSLASLARANGTAPARSGGPFSGTAANASAAAAAAVPTAAPPRSSFANNRIVKAILFTIRIALYAAIAVVRFMHVAVVGTATWLAVLANPYFFWLASGTVIYALSHVLVAIPVNRFLRRHCFRLTLHLPNGNGNNNRNNANINNNNDNNNNNDGAGQQQQQQQQNDNNAGPINFEEEAADSLLDRLPALLLWISHMLLQEHLSTVRTVGISVANTPTYLSDLLRKRSHAAAAAAAVGDADGEAEGGGEERFGVNAKPSSSRAPFSLDPIIAPLVRSADGATRSVFYAAHETAALFGSSYAEGGSFGFGAGKEEGKRDGHISSLLDDIVFIPAAPSSSHPYSPTLLASVTRPRHIKRSKYLPPKRSSSPQTAGGGNKQKNRHDDSTIGSGGRGGGGVAPPSTPRPFTSLKTRFPLNVVRYGFSLILYTVEQSGSLLLGGLAAVGLKLGGAAASGGAVADGGAAAATAMLANISHTILTAGTVNSTSTHSSPTSTEGGAGAAAADADPTAAFRLMVTNPIMSWQLDAWHIALSIETMISIVTRTMITFLNEWEAIPRQRRVVGGFSMLFIYFGVILCGWDMFWFSTSEIALLFPMRSGWEAVPDGMAMEEGAAAGGSDGAAGVGRSGDYYSNARDREVGEEGYEADGASLSRPFFFSPSNAAPASATERYYPDGGGYAGHTFSAAASADEDNAGGGGGTHSRSSHVRSSPLRVREVRNSRTAIAFSAVLNDVYPPLSVAPMMLFVLRALSLYRFLGLFSAFIRLVYRSWLREFSVEWRLFRVLRRPMLVRAWALHLKRWREGDAELLFGYSKYSSGGSRLRKGRGRRDRRVRQPRRMPFFSLPFSLFGWRRQPDDHQPQALPSPLSPFASTAASPASPAASSSAGVGVGATHHHVISSDTVTVEPLTFFTLLRAIFIRFPLAVVTNLFFRPLFGALLSVSWWRSLRCYQFVPRTIIFLFIVYHAFAQPHLSVFKSWGALLGFSSSAAADAAAASAAASSSSSSLASSLSPLWSGGGSGGVGVPSAAAAPSQLTSGHFMQTLFSPLVLFAEFILSGFGWYPPTLFSRSSSSAAAAAAPTAPTAANTNGNGGGVEWDALAEYQMQSFPIFAVALYAVAIFIAFIDLCEHLYIARPISAVLVGDERERELIVGDVLADGGPAAVLAVYAVRSQRINHITEQLTAALASHLREGRGGGGAAGGEGEAGAGVDGGAPLPSSAASSSAPPAAAREEGRALRLISQALSSYSSSIHALYSSNDPVLRALLQVLSPFSRIIRTYIWVRRVFFSSAAGCKVLLITGEPILYEDRLSSRIADGGSSNSCSAATSRAGSICSNTNGGEDDDDTTFCCPTALEDTSAAVASAVDRLAQRSRRVFLNSPIGLVEVPAQEPRPLANNRGAADKARERGSSPPAAAVATDDYANEDDSNSNSTLLSPPSPPPPLECTICCEDIHPMAASAYLRTRRPHRPPTTAELRGVGVRLLPCGHVFHQGCILPWLEAHRTCVLCRGVVVYNRALLGRALACVGVHGKAYISGRSVAGAEAEAGGSSSLASATMPSSSSAATTHVVSVPNSALRVEVDLSRALAPLPQAAAAPSTPFWPPASRGERRAAPDGEVASGAVAAADFFAVPPPLPQSPSVPIVMPSDSDGGAAAIGGDILGVGSFLPPRPNPNPSVAAVPRRRQSAVLTVPAATVEPIVATNRQGAARVLRSTFERFGIDHVVASMLHAVAMAVEGSSSSGGGGGTAATTASATAAVAPAEQQGTADVPAPRRAPKRSRDGSEEAAKDTAAVDAVGGNNGSTSHNNEAKTTEKEATEEATGNAAASSANPTEKKAVVAAIEKEDEEATVGEKRMRDGRSVRAAQSAAAETGVTSGLAEREGLATATVATAGVDTDAEVSPRDVSPQRSPRPAAKGPARRA